MIKFDSDHIIAGHIKEMLMAFNMPRYRIYSKRHAELREKLGHEANVFPTISKGVDLNNMQYAPYVKDGTVQYYNKKPQSEGGGYEWADTNEIFSYDAPKLPWTTGLKTNSCIYDYHMHEYLGDFLRAKRDCEGIDLMPLYNCFGGRICQKVALREDHATHKYAIDASDPNFKIYMLPVKIGQPYTIAADCAAGIEVCCGIYGKYQDTSIDLSSWTYARFRKTVFGKPELYDCLAEIDRMDLLSTIGGGERDLKLFIKMPATANTSVVVLEGDYRNFNDSIVKFSNGSLKRAQNRAITNFDTSINDFSRFRPVTPLQLLRINTGVSHPFADRLVEYLLGNAVDPSDEIADNVRRAQAVMAMSADNSDINARIWDNAQQAFVKKECGGVLPEALRPAQDGVWTDAMRAIAYDRFNLSVKANVNDRNHDILGYIDKDVEAQVAAPSKQLGTADTTISGIDLYTKNGLYDDSGEE